MAGLAISKARVVECDIMPIAGRMAINALAAIMRRRGGVASCAICITVVVEDDGSPVVKCVAVCT